MMVINGFTHTRDRASVFSSRHFPLLRRKSWVGGEGGGHSSQILCLPMNSHNRKLKPHGGMKRKYRKPSGAPCWRDFAGDDLVAGACGCAAAAAIVFSAAVAPIVFSLTTAAATAVARVRLHVSRRRRRCCRYRRAGRRPALPPSLLSAAAAVSCRSRCRAAASIVPLPLPPSCRSRARARLLPLSQHLHRECHTRLNRTTGAGAGAGPGLATTTLLAGSSWPTRHTIRYDTIRGTRGPGRGRPTRGVPEVADKRHTHGGVIFFI